MSAPTYGAQGAVTAMSLAVSIFDQVADDFLEVLYPDHDWRKVFGPGEVMKDVNAGAQNYVQMVRDQRGAGAFQANIKGNNIPMVGLSLGAITIPLAASAIGARITNEDARQYDFGFRSTLTKDIAAVLQQGLENLIEGSTMFGDPSVGFKSFLSYTGITSVSAAVGASGATAWSGKTGAEMVADVNAGLTYVYVNSRTVFIPNEVFLPPTQFSLLNATPMVIGGAGVSETALTFLKKANLYTAITGKELKIATIRYLQGAAAANQDRMIIATSSSPNRKTRALPMPLPYTLQPAQPVPLGAAYYAEQKHGSVAIFQSGSMVYVDGI